MNTETMQVTSQGEFIHKDASLEAKKPVESTLLIEDQPTLLTIEDAPKTGLISGLWNRVLGTTEAVVHMAEVASQTVKENASGLIATAHDAAVAAEQAGEKWVEVTKEYVMDIEHKVEETAETKKDQLLELGSELQSQAQSTLSTVSQKLHDLSEVVVEQGQAKASELYDTASVVGEQAKEKASEALASAQVIGQQALESDTAKTVVSVGNDALEQAKEVGQQALAAGQKVIEQVNNEGVEGVAAKAKGMGLRAFSAAANLGSQAGIPLSKSASARRLKKSASANNTSEHSPKQTLALTMDVVSHIQRIADRTGDAVLHETARKAHSACAKGLSDAPGVHLVWITPQQANDLVNLAIRTQDHELADFARYCQSVAATTHIGVEPTPGKIQEEIQKGYQELQQQGRVHTGPGYGAAFASVNRTYAVTSTDAAVPQATTAAPLQKSASLKRMNSQSNMQPPQLVLTMDVVSHIQRIADRTGNAVLHETARKAHSACAKGESDAPGVHLTWITPQQASELMNLASRTTNQELIDFARYCQSVAATTQVGVEPSPGKIQEEILKGRQELQKAQLLQPAAPVEAVTSTPVVSQEPAMLAAM